jgi:hypothetical protein
VSWFDTSGRALSPVHLFSPARIHTGQI